MGTPSQSPIVLVVIPAGGGPVKFTQSRLSERPQSCLKRNISLPCDMVLLNIFTHIPIIGFPVTILPVIRIHILISQTVLLAKHTEDPHPISILNTSRISHSEIHITIPDLRTRVKIIFSGPVSIVQGTLVINLNLVFSLRQQIAHNSVDHSPTRVAIVTDDSIRVNNFVTR